jgi:branched-chain amino acid transport system permease protein
MTFFYAYLSQCWNILGGYAGQLSLGPVAFFGIGAYTSSVLYVKWGLTPWFGLLFGGVLATLVGSFSGYVSFHYGLRGPYFALVTLTFAEILRIVALNLDWIGGAAGIQIPLKGSSFYHFQFQSRVPYYYIILFLIVLVIYITQRIEVSRLGNYLVAIRENEDAAEAIGVDTVRNKVHATALSSGLMALGGTFYTQYILFIEPEMGFGFHLTIEIILRAIIGGLGTVFGPILGSFMLTPLSELTRAYFAKGGSYGLHLVIYGAVLVAVVLFLPEGVIKRAASWYGKYLSLGRSS